VRTCTAVLVSGVLAVAGTVAPAQSRTSAGACPSGTVALTFDDGPATAVTGRLLDVLSSRGVPATFFVLGQRVAASPALVRRAHRLGFAVANHTYRHEMLTRLSDDGIRRTVRATTGSIRDAGARPAPLVRPPYGAVDNRVRAVLGSMGMTTVLWDIDPRDWESGTPEQIAERVLSHLRPHGRNIVLLHDGVARSGNTLRAVPLIVSRARDRGYCFAPVGGSAPPRPQVRVEDTEGREAGAGATTTLAFDVRLDRTAPRRTSVRVRTLAGTATAGLDYRAVDRRVAVPAGATGTRVRVEVLGDRIDETRETLRLRLGDPRGLRIADGGAVGVIRDDDPRPRVRLADVTVTEPGDGAAHAIVVLRLDRPSSRSVEARVATVAGTAGPPDYAPLDAVVALPAGRTRATVPVDVLADALPEDVEAFEVRVLSVTRARVGDGVATVTIEPPPQPAPVEPTTAEPAATTAAPAG